VSAKFSGVPVTKVLILAYALSGLCSALVGVMLSGFTGQAFNDMGDPYLLTSIAVVVVGGTLMTGGRGHYAGMLGGALMLTALSTLLSGSSLPVAARGVVYGLVVLAAVVAMREKRAS
jgi:ribose transport system permease protein